VLHIDTQVSPTNPGRHSTSKLSAVLAISNVPRRGIASAIPAPGTTASCSTFTENDSTTSSGKFSGESLSITSK
jgi:hypothetical protein